jgi:hypothetical protein
MTEGSGFVPSTNGSGSGSGRPKNLQILRIWVRNTVKRIMGTLIGFNAEPDPAFYLHADPEPGSEINADPCGLRSWSDFAITKI